MRRMKRVRTGVALGACLLAGAPLLASAQDIESFQARAPSAEAYPDDDALVLYEEIALTLHPDGRVDRYTRHLRKYFTAYEVDGHADPRIAFDSERQSLEILRWQTVMPSGQLVEKKERAFNQVTPDAVGLAPDYAALQEVVATHLGMEEGAVVEREYVVRDQVAWRDALSGVELLQGRLPVLETVIRITVPATTELRFEVVGGEAEYRTEAAGASVTHIWRVGKRPGVPTHSVANIELDCLPWLVYSTAGSWEALAWVWNERIEACAQMSDRLREELVEITRDAQDQSEKVRLVHEAVLNDVRSVSLRPPWGGATCRPAAAVFETGYGDGLDKAVLLLAWLRELGVEAEPVLVSRSLAFADEVPCAEQLPEVWVVAWADGHLIWMDPFHALDARSVKDLGGCRYLRLSEDPALDLVPERNDGQSQSLVKVTATMEKDGSAAGEARVHLSGVFSPYYGVSGVGDEAKDYVHSLASDLFGGVEIESYNLMELSEDVVVFGFRFRREAGEGDGNLLLEMPGFAEKVDIPGFEGIAPERTLPLVLPARFESRVDVEVDLWEGADVLRIPDAVSIDAPFGLYRLRCDSEEGTVRFERRIVITDRRIAPAGYPQFRSMWLRDQNPTSATLILAGE